MPLSKDVSLDIQISSEIETIHEHTTVSVTAPDQRGFVYRIAQVFAELESPRILVQPKILGEKDADDVVDRVTIDGISRVSLAPEDLRMEDAPLEALASLRAQLVEALAMVDGATASLTTRAIAWPASFSAEGVSA